MRKVSFALAAGFLIACGGGEQQAQPTTAQNPPAPTATTPPAPTAEPPKPEEAPKPSPAEAMKKTMADFGAAMQAKDAKKLASLYADSGVIKFPGMPDTVGRDAIAGMWQKNFDAFPDSKSAPSRIFVKGDVAVVEWTWTGTQTKDMGPIKATEKKVGVNGADVMWFNPDGQIKESHTYMDMGTVMSQLGVSKQKARPLATLPSTPPQMVMGGGADEQKNVDAVTKMMGAFEKKNDADFLGAAADDIAWDDMTMPDTMKGKAAGKKFFKDVTTAFPDLKVSIQNSWGVGDYVIMEDTMQGTMKGAFMGIPAKNKPVNMHGLDIVQMKDGKVVHGWTYANGAEMAQQLGLVPAPGAEAPKGDAKAAPKKDEKAAPKKDEKAAPKK